MFRYLLLLSLAATSGAAQIRYVARLSSNLGAAGELYGPAKAAPIPELGRIAAGPDGTIYLTSNARVYRVTPDGVLAPLSSWNNGHDGPPGGPALITDFKTPYAVAVDAAGNLYVASHHEPSHGWPAKEGSIRRISPEGYVSDVTREVWGAGLALGPEGNLYVTAGPRIWKVSLDGQATVVGGTGEKGSDGDGGLATEARTDAYDIDVAPDGTIYIAEPYAHRVRKITPDGVILPVAGTGEQGFTGDGGPASEAQLNLPFAVKLDGAGNLLVADYGNNRVRMITRDGIIQTFAGSEYEGYWGDGGPAVEARLEGPVGLAIDAAGNVYIADSGNARIRRVGPDGVIRTFAGCGGKGGGGCAGDGGPVSLAHFASPRGMAKDAAGNLYVADEQNHRVRRISRDGTVTTVAGNGESWFSGDGGPATEARLSFPADVAVDGAGNLYIADSGNHRVRRVLPDGTVETVAGNGAVGSGGDGGPAVEAQLTNPEGVAVDAAGNLYIADTGNHKIRKVTPDGIITTIAGTGQPGSDGDGGLATEAQLVAPKGITVAGDGTLYVADSGADRVRKITLDGTIQTVSLGTAPADVALDSLGNLYISYSAGREVRVIKAGGDERKLDFRDRLGDAVTVAPGSLQILSGGDFVFAERNALWIAARSPAALPLERPVLFSVGSAAYYAPRAVAPGLVVTLWGREIGPGVGVAAPVTEGKLPTELAETRVFFDGIPAPLLWVSDRQVNAVAPWGLEPGTLVEVELEYRGDRSPVLRVPVVEAVPAIFPGAILKQDYSVPSNVNPVRPGEVIMIWATGLGPIEPEVEDGRIQTDVLPRPVLPVTATIGGRPAQVLYAGGAPGFVAGAFQVNVVVPPGVETTEWGQTTIYLRAGSISSQEEVWFSVETGQQQ